MPSLESSVQRIGVAVVHQAGHVLVGRRGEEAPLAGRAEFPGGKCRQDESAAECALRECLEETGVRIDVERLILEIEWTYPHGTVHLGFYLCRPAEPESLAEPCGTFRWVPWEQLPDLDFPEANQAVIDWLMEHRPPEISCL